MDGKEIDANKREDGSGKEAGYCNPPKDTRFRKGCSGNPKGRPRRSASFVEMFQRTLREKVIINENGRRRRISKLEAAIKQQVNKAASGDQKALKLLAGIGQLIRSVVVEAPVQEPSFTDADKKIIERLLTRFNPVREVE